MSMSFGHKAGGHRQYWRRAWATRPMDVDFGDLEIGIERTSHERRRKGAAIMPMGFGHRADTYRA